MKKRNFMIYKLFRTAFHRRQTAALFLCIVSCFFLCLSGAMAAQGAVIPGLSQDAGEGQQRVFDQAGLFSADEARQLEQDISSLRQKTGMDVVIVTTQDAAGLSARDYADNFYIQGNFGKGSEYDGILFLIDMDNRELAVNPAGKMNRYITDERRKTILDVVYEGAAAEDFMDSAEQFLAYVSTFYEKGIRGNQYNYDENTGKISAYKSIRWYEALLAIGVAAFAGVCACLNVTRSYAMKKERRQAGNYNMAYRADCGFHFANQTDNLINKVVSQAVIPRDTGSSGGGVGSSPSSGRTTTHTSSGRTFGGSSRKF